MCGFWRMVINFPSSLMGRSYWKKISERIRDRQDRVFLLPLQDDSYSSIVTRYLEEYYEFHRINRMIILVEDKKYSDMIRRIENDRIEVIDCDGKIIKRLLNYYTVNNFDNRFVVASLERPDTRRVIESMIGCKGVTAEQIIRAAIMHLPIESNGGEQDGKDKKTDS